MSNQMNNQMSKQSERGEIVRQMSEFIKDKTKAERVLLFGSCARGDMVSDSDVDMLVILQTDKKPYQEAVAIRKMLDKQFGIPFPLDLVVRTPEQIQKRLELGDFFFKHVMNEGVYL